MKFKFIVPLTPRSQVENPAASTKAGVQSMTAAFQSSKGARDANDENAHGDAPPENNSV